VTELAGVAPSSMRSVYAEDLSVGRTYQLDSYRVTEAEIVEFASRWDPQFFHLDAEDARNGYFGGLIASGIQTTAIFSRLTALACFQHWNIVAGKGFRDLRFLCPVGPGDVLAGSLVIDRVVFRGDRPATVLSHGNLWNQDGREVFTVVAEFVVDTCQGVRPRMR